MHDIAITQKYIVFPVVARTTSDARLKTGEPMWEWNGDLPTMSATAIRRCRSKAEPGRYFVGPVGSLQESCFVSRGAVSNAGIDPIDQHWVA